MPRAGVSLGGCRRRENQPAFSRMQLRDFENPAMRFLPIVERELRVAARRRSTYWTRFGAGLVGIVLAGWVMLAMSDRPPAEVGQWLFYSLSLPAFGYSLLTGVRNTSDCVSEEKR